MELLSSNIKNFQETETPKKKNSYISGNRNPKKAFYILGNGTFQSTPRKFILFLEIETLKKILMLPEMELSYILGNVTFLYFRKGIFRIIEYLHLEIYSEPWYI